jgi:hypothetical protein
MVNVNHSTLTDPYLHEPKGVATAQSGSIYVADGAGTGLWKIHHQVAGAYIPFDSTTPAYTHSCTTSDTPINPTFEFAYNEGFTAEADPARVIYSGVQDISSQITLTLSTKQASGSQKDIIWSIYKNGSLLLGSQTIRTISSGTWGSITITGYTTLSQNDYISVYSRSSANCSVEYAAGFLTITGLPEL